MAKNLQIRYCEALKAIGEVPIAGLSSKWLKFTRKQGGFYFLGKSGSLRFGQNYTTSIPVSHVVKEMLLSEIVK